jgi:hypothetical protein
MQLLEMYYNLSMHVSFEDAPIAMRAWLNAEKIA